LVLENSGRATYQLKEHCIPAITASEKRKPSHTCTMAPKTSTQRGGTASVAAVATSKVFGSQPRMGTAEMPPMPPMTGGATGYGGYSSFMPGLNTASEKRASPATGTKAAAVGQTPGAFHNYDEEEFDYGDSNEEEEVPAPAKKGASTSAAGKAAAAKGAASATAQAKGKGSTPTSAPTAPAAAYGATAQANQRKGGAQPPLEAIPSGKFPAGYSTGAQPNLSMPYGNYGGADHYSQFNQPYSNLKPGSAAAASKVPSSMPGPSPYGMAPPPMTGNPYMMPNGAYGKPYPPPVAARPAPPVQRASSSAKITGAESSGKRTSQHSHRRSRSGSTIEVKGWERTRPRPNSRRLRTTSSADKGLKVSKSRSSEYEDGEMKGRSSGGKGRNAGGGNGLCVIL